MKYRSFEDMPVWKEAMSLAQDVFHLTKSLPRKEDYGLTSQLRRSALSISANIAEAFGRKHSKDKVNFYYHSRGSLMETRNHLIYGKNVGYFETEAVSKIFARIEDIWTQINYLTNSIGNRPTP